MLGLCRNATAIASSIVRTLGGSPGSGWPGVCPLKSVTFVTKPGFTPGSEAFAGRGVGGVFAEG
jgi:hypothetical protein